MEKGHLSTSSPNIKYWKDVTIEPKYKRLEDNIDHLRSMPKMSTKAIGLIINSLVENMSNDEAYVNVGFWHGFSILAGMAGNPTKTCIGIDNFSQFGGPKKQFKERFNKYKSDKHFFFDLDYTRYFKKYCEEKIGVYFYDGNHSRENQKNGLLKAEPYFAKGCYVIIDDANADKVRKGTDDFLEVSEYNYKKIIDVKTRGNYHPTFWNGLMLFKRIN